MYCIRLRGSFLGWTLAERSEEAWAKFDNEDSREAGWAKINASVECVQVTLIIMEKGVVCG